jgi:hypothetical protein
VGFSRRTLRQLERRGRGSCQECGLPPDGPGRMVLIDDGTPAEGFPDDPGGGAANAAGGRCGALYGLFTRRRGRGS